MPSQPSRRRFQFRLRTLFVVVTLIALACGWAMDRVRLVRERDKAIQSELGWRKEADELRVDQRAMADKYHECVQQLARLEQELADKK